MEGCAPGLTLMFKTTQKWPVAKTYMSTQKPVEEEWWSG